MELPRHNHFPWLPAGDEGSLPVWGRAPELPHGSLSLPANGRFIKLLSANWCENASGSWAELFLHLPFALS